MTAATIDTSMVAAKVDGRHGRKAHTRALILAACRVRMIGGTFRPPMSLCCDLASRSARAGFEIFGNADALYIEALQDPATRDAILNRVLAHELGSTALVDMFDGETADRIARAVVLGKATA